MKIYPARLTNRNHTRLTKQPSLQGLTQHPKTQTPKNNLQDYKKTAGYGAMALLAVVSLYYIQRGKNTSEYAKVLAKSMTAATGKKVPPSKLSSVMSGDELFKTLPSLKRENYTYTQENAAAGIFRADLHSHSNHSDGDGYVQTILEDAAEYANKLYSKTKQKFIFALTDHDTVEGVKEALQIISSNPKKYKNLQFVPGIEVSFAHSSPNSTNACEMSEVLVYGINPYSEKVSTFLNNIKTKREDMIKNFIAEADKRCPLSNLNFEEFSKHYEFEKYGNLMNIHWRAYHYVQTKHAAAIQAGANGRDAGKFYEEIVNGMPFPTIKKLKDSGKLNPGTMDEAPEFKDILEQAKPHFQDGKLIAQSENTFEEIIDAFKDEPEVFMSYAHPFYFTEYTGNIEPTLKYFTEKSEGLIKASESYHQAYGERVKPEIIEEIKNQTEKLNLLNTGGRDNHKERLF